MRSNRNISLGRTLETNNGRTAYIKHLQSISDDKKRERERLRGIQEVSKGEKVELIYNCDSKFPYSITGTVLRVCDKTYKISLDDDYVLIDKESLSGFANSLIKETTGDSRRYIGSKIKLIIKDKKCK